MRSRGFSYPARRPAKKRIFLLLLIAAVVAAGFFLRKKPYEYPFLWSQAAVEKMNFENAGKYCENLEENSFDDWHLPELYEIRTLADKCLEEENPDFCAITDSCEWNSCKSELCGKCVKYEENVDFGSFWTKTQLHGGKVFTFTISEETEENQADKNETHFTKCVRKK